MMPVNPKPVNSTWRRQGVVDSLLEYSGDTIMLSDLVIFLMPGIGRSCRLVIPLIQKVPVSAGMSSSTSLSVDMKNFSVAPTSNKSSSSDKLPA